MGSIVKWVTASFYELEWSRASTGLCVDVENNIIQIDLPDGSTNLRPALPARINIETEIVNGERGHYLVSSVRVKG